MYCRQDEQPKPCLRVAKTFPVCLEWRYCGRGSMMKRSSPKVTYVASAHQGSRSAHGTVIPVASITRSRKVETNLVCLKEVAGGKVVRVAKLQTIFTQGDKADAVFYVRKGRVRLTVVSKTGREVTIGHLGVGSCFGEGALGGQACRTESAVAMTNCELLRFDKRAMSNTLHVENEFFDLFVALLLELNGRYEEVLVDHLFNSSENRLARAQSLLAALDQESMPDNNQEMLDILLQG